MVATGPGIRGNRECQEKLPRIKSSQCELTGRESRLEHPEQARESARGCENHSWAGAQEHTLTHPGVRYGLSKSAQSTRNCEICVFWA